MLLEAHESIAGGVSQAFARAEEHGARALQIFTKNARGWSAPALTEQERRAFRAEARRTGLPSIAHGSYLVNLGFAAGYDISTERGYEEVMAECEATVGLERVRCFHLNDCKKPLGCRVDRHEEVGKGSIGRVAFQCLVNAPRFVNTIGVLETPFPERYGETLRLLESLRRRQ